MSEQTRLWTVNEVLALNETCCLRLEVLDGELLRPDDAPPSWESALRLLVEELRAAQHPYLRES